MGNKGHITTDIKEFGDTDALLKKLDVTLRGIVLMKALKKSGDPVVRLAKRLVPVGGAKIDRKKGFEILRPGRKRGKKHLRDTITSIVKDYGETKVLVVGPSYPSGAHGHLVEFGHAEYTFGNKKLGIPSVPTGRQVPPKPFLRPAAEQTKIEQVAAFQGELTKWAEKP